MTRHMWIASFALLFFFFGIASGVMALELKSTAFTPNGTIPAKHACSEKANISPSISWDNAPKGTKSFALIMDDPQSDAPMGAWVHWVI